MLLITLLLTCFSIITAIIVYFKWTFQYWKKKGVVISTPTVPFGNVTDLFLARVSFGELWRRLYNEFKQKNLRYGGCYFLTKNVFIPVDPEIYKHVLQKDFDNFINHGNYVDDKGDPLNGHLFAAEDTKWRYLRPKLTPFTTNNIKTMYHKIIARTNDLRISIKNEIGSKNIPIDIKDLFGRFATDVIGSVAFDINCNSLLDEKSKYRQHGQLVFRMRFLELLKSTIQYAVPRKLLLALGFKITKKEVEKFFLSEIKKLVENREKNNIYRNDVLHLLLQLKNMGRLTGDERITDSKIGEVGLNMNDLTAQVFLFFIAGFETSTTLMSMALYEMALNPNIQKKVREEMNETLHKYNQEFTYDAVMEMKYLDKVIHETLRKYPPVPMLMRACNKDYKVPNSNLTIEKGTQVVLSVLGLHYDNQYYPNPMLFDPERFSEEAKNSRPPFTYLPFAAGPRNCLGSRLGMLQSKIGLLTVLREYEVSVSTKTDEPLVFDVSCFILGFENQIYMNFNKIEK